MAAREPLSRIVLAATSVSDDLGFVALVDLASIIGAAGSASYRVIGGPTATTGADRRRGG